MLRARSDIIVSVKLAGLESEEVPFLTQMNVKYFPFFVITHCLEELVNNNYLPSFAFYFSFQTVF